MNFEDELSKIYKKKKKKIKFVLLGIKEKMDRIKAQNYVQVQLFKALKE